MSRITRSQAAQGPTHVRRARASLGLIPSFGRPMASPIGPLSKAPRNGSRKFILRFPPGRNRSQQGSCRDRIGGSRLAFYRIPITIFARIGESTGRSSWPSWQERASGVTISTKRSPDAALLNYLRASLLPHSEF